VVADSRSLRSAPTAWTRGIDGGKLIKGVKVFAICDKYGSLFDRELGPANTDDRTGTRPTLPRLAALGFQGDLLGDSGFMGVLFATAALAHDIHVAVAPGGTPLRLVEPLPAAQHRVRPRARPRCGAHLDRDDFHHLTSALSPSAARDLIAYSFLDR